MVNWNVSIKAAPSNPDNFLVAAIYDASAPLVVVDFIVLQKPYGDTKNITFMGLEEIVYEFKLFESESEAPEGTELNNFSFQPSPGTITVIRDDLFLVAGETEGFETGGTEYDDPSLVGWIWQLERLGFGTMRPGVDYAQKETGGFELLIPDDQFGDGEKFVIHFQPQVTSASTGSGGGGGGGTGNFIAGTVILDEDIELDNSYMKKACILQGTSEHFTVTLPALNTVGENQHIIFISEGGSHINATIKAAGTDSILYKGDNKAEMVIGQSEHLWLFKANGAWNVANADGNFLKVGEVVYSYKKSDLINAVFANGSLLSRTAYKRLWEEVNEMESDVLIDDSQWNVTQNVNGRTVFVNRGKFTRGDGSTTFRVPLIYAVGNLKAVDGATRKAGSYESDMVGPHSHTLIVPANKTSKTDQGVGRFVTGSDGFEPNAMDAVGTENNSGTETREQNFGIYALIRC